MPWTVQIDYIRTWLDAQDDKTVAAVAAAAEILERVGPALGRPLVDSISSTKMHNLKELRPASPGRSEIRILFAFDPERRAVFLVAGDKAGATRADAKWNAWYRRAIPMAERIYAAHLCRVRRKE